MNSLLQHRGPITSYGVGLVFQRPLPIPDTFPYTHVRGFDDTFDCPICDKKHIKLYTAFRKPVRMCGYWVVFHYCEEEHVPDLSVPISVYKLPQDAKAMNAEAAHYYWTSKDD
jgi:hypothetical protein